MSKIAPKRCPFCGAPGIVATPPFAQDGIIVECSNPAMAAGPKDGCDVAPCTLPFTTAAGAIRAWNKRARL